MSDVKAFFHKFSGSGFIRRAGALLLALCGGSALGADFSTIVTISTEEAERRMAVDEKVVVLDVRTPEEYASGHIPGALCLPVESIGEQRPEILPDLNREILIYCRSGRRSHMAAVKLAALGYDHLYDFGGIQSWRGDVVKGSEPGTRQVAVRHQAGNLPLSALELSVNDAALKVSWEDNAAVAALGKLADAGLTVSLKPYGGFEQVGSLGQTLPHEDVRLTARPGDVMLYQGRQIVLFYGSNTWEYTPLGHIEDLSTGQLEALLGGGSAVLRLRMGR